MSLKSRESIRVQSLEFATSFAIRKDQCLELLKKTPDSQKHGLGKRVGDRDRGGGGGQNVPNARGGENSPRKLPLEDLDF